MIELKAHPDSSQDLLRGYIRKWWPQHCLQAQEMLSGKAGECPSTAPRNNKAAFQEKKRVHPNPQVLFFLIIGFYERNKAGTARLSQEKRLRVGKVEGVAHSHQQPVSEPESKEWQEKQVPKSGHVSKPWE